MDPERKIYVTGDARSNDLPVTPGAIDSEPDGSTAFAEKLSPEGSQLIYSTFIGDGAGGDELGRGTRTLSRRSTCGIAPTPTAVT